MTRLRHVPALDGLRGVAVILVVAYHLTGWPLGGAAGVDLFFVLSGFLITSLLLEEAAATGTVDLAGFYARRARRLLPALAVLLVAFAAVSLGKGLDPAHDLARAGFYTGNLFRATGGDELAHSGIRHLWSLAEEEQFYLLWPLLLLVLARSRRILPIILGAVTALIVYRAALVAGGFSASRIFYGPDTRADGLLLGATAAILHRRGRLRVSKGTLPLTLVVFVSLIVLPGLTGNWLAVGLPTFEVCCCVLLAAAVTGTSLARRLSWRPLVWVGEISYSLYLWHFTIWWALDYRFPLMAAVFSVAAAWLSTRYVEKPFRHRRSPQLLGVPSAFTASRAAR